jgi:hypothetical protein
MEAATHNAAHNICLAIDKEILENIYKEAPYVPTMEIGDFRGLYGSGRIGMLYGYKLFQSKLIPPDSNHGYHST